MRASDSARFWGEQLTRLVHTSGLRALVWDGLDFVWMSSESRVNSTSEQHIADRGLADAAFKVALREAGPPL